MIQGVDLSHLLLSILFFPSFFQKDFLLWAWGAADPLWIMVAKRTLLLLPVAAVLAGLWISIVCVVSLIFRQRRADFFSNLLVTWWDLGKAVFSFWGGFFKFFIVFPGAVLGLIGGMLMFLWFVVEDIFLTPYRLAKNVAQSVTSPGLPWIAFVITVVWCLLEAVIFTYVMTPLVLDTLSNMTGDQLTENVVRIPLFLFMLFLIMGSYAVLNTWAQAVASKNIAAIFRITVVELVSMSVEVLFLYREFVDSLVPWFAQHASKDFDIGVTGTLGIAFFMWLGIRGMTWFLFASHGTPTLLAMIQGSGLNSGAAPAAGEPAKPREASSLTIGFTRQLMERMDWVKQKGDEVLGAFVLPPLQVVAAAINFLTLLVTSRHLFDLPFKSVRLVLDNRPHLAMVKAEHKAAGPKDAPSEV